MLELIVLLLLIAVAFVWFFMAGLTERKTGRKNILAWPFILTYWYGLGRPKPVKKAEKTSIDSDHASLSENIKKLNENICLLIQRMEKLKAKEIVAAKEKTNQGE